MDIIIQGPTLRFSRKVDILTIERGDYHGDDDDDELSSIEG